MKPTVGEYIIQSPEAEGGTRKATQFVGTFAKNCQLFSVEYPKTSTPLKCTGTCPGRVGRGACRFS